MAGTTQRTKGRPLTPEQVEEIGRRRLRGETVRSIADALDCSHQTVQTHWNKIRDRRSKEYQEQLDRYRAEIISRLFRIADDAAANADTATDEKTAAAYHGAETRALLEASKLLGLEQAQKVEHSGEVGFTILELGEEVRVDDDEVDD